MELRQHHDIHIISKLHDRYSHEQKQKADVDESHWNSMDRKKRKERDKNPTKKNTHKLDQILQVDDLPSHLDE